MFGGDGDALVYSTSSKDRAICVIMCRGWVFLGSILRWEGEGAVFAGKLALLVVLIVGLAITRVASL